MDEERARRLLTAARGAAEAELARLRGTGPGDGDEQADASVASEEIVAHETDSALIELLTRRLEAIDAAEERVRRGTYGRSVRGGAPIPDERLEIEPWAELTVEEQAAS
jgi:RNA polymerase-binding transcription factor